LHRPFLCAQASAAGAWLFPCLGYEPDQPCLRCLPPRLFAGGADTASPAALFLGTVQATEATKLILGLDRSSHGKLLSYQLPTLKFSSQLVANDPSCSLCATQKA